VEATDGYAGDTLTLTVRAATRATLALVPARLNLEVGESATVTGGEGPEPLTWKVSDPTRLRITPRGTRGAMVAALAPGTVELTARSADGSTDAITVTIESKASLQLAASQVAFEMQANGGPPEARTVGIVHTGAGTVTLQEPEYTGAGGWLSREMQSDLLTIRPTSDAGKLPPGKYSARLVLSDGRNRETLTVTLTVNEKAPSPEPPVGATRTQLQEVIDGYVKAINAGDTTAIRRTYPTISAKGLKEVLASRSSGKYDLMLRTEPKPGSAPGTLEAQVTALYDGGKKAGAVPLIYSFAWQEGRWVIVGWKVSR
jgi:hypothetical protein